jgi:hypothetical protein
MNQWDVSNLQEYWVKKDIVSWNTSNDTSVPNIFHGPEASNQDISSWDVSNMTDMSHVFSDSKKSARTCHSCFGSLATGNVSTMRGI